MIQKFSYHWFRIYFSSALQTTTEVGYRPWRQRLLNGSTEFQSHRVLLLQGHLVLKPRHGLLPLHLGSSFFFETGDTKDIQKHNWCTHTHMMYNWYTKDIKSDAQMKYRRYTWNTHEKQINYLGVILMFFMLARCVSPWAFDLVFCFHQWGLKPWCLWVMMQYNPRDPLW